VPTLSCRDAFADYRHVVSALRFRSPCDGPPPLLSITIPTYRRPTLLKEAIASAVRQATDIPYEIVVVDNDESGAGFTAIEDELAEITGVRLSYYVNSGNTGMFGNWNRCIELAKAPWVTILNDDDLLYPAFVQTIFAKLAAHPTIDGIVCRQAEFYRDRNLTVPDPDALRTRIRARVQGLRFDRHGLMKVTPKKLFFGNDARSSLGFVFRQAAATAVGGFDPQDFPAADYYFFVRFAMRYQLCCFYRTLAAVGIGDNESMKIETVARYLYQCAEIREALADVAVPSSWLRMNPALTAHALANMEKVWNVKLDWRQVERDLNITLPEPSLNKVRLYRLMHGGY
jgi:glycosyltransferase involved in cell wall biosynthesis